MLLGSPAACIRNNDIKRTNENKIEYIPNTCGQNNFKFEAINLLELENPMPQNELSPSKASQTIIDLIGIIGIKNIFLYDLPNQRLDDIPILKINKIIEKHVFEIKPDTVYIHTKNDINIDHRIAHEASLVACRKVKNIFAFEIIYSTTNEFKPNLFVDINDAYPIKYNALKL